MIGLADKDDHRDELDRLFELSPEFAIIRGFSILESRLDEVKI